jgi:DNA-binding HxlR family transcriptional regulator
MPKETCKCVEGECLCPVQGIIDVVGKKWAICIVNHLGRATSLRYNEIRNQIGAISPKTLSDTLKALEKERLITREVYPETPPRVEYSLTKEGKELKTALLPLLQWLQKH